MANKSKQKHVKFDFYEVCIELDVEFLKDNLEELEQQLSIASNLEKIKLSRKAKRITDLIQRAGRSCLPYDLKELIHSMQIGEIPTNYEVYDKLTELDINTILPKEDKQNDHIFFQVSNNRDTDLPAKKQLGEAREEIDLDDDEYIGEFMSVYYSLNTGTAMIQVNRYSLTPHQLEVFFTQARYKKIGKNDGRVISLLPLIDTESLKDMEKSNYYTKIHIKGSDVSMSAIPDECETICKVKNVLKGVKGVNIDLTLSIDSRRKDASPLSDDEVKEIYRYYPDDDTIERPNIEVYYKKDKESKIEVANWLTPKMTTLLHFTIKPRESLGYEIVYQKMRERFEDNRSKINKYHYSKNGLKENEKT